MIFDPNGPKDPERSIEGNCLTFETGFRKTISRIAAHIGIVCMYTAYSRDAALGPSKISARRNDNRLSDNESPLSPPFTIPRPKTHPLCYYLSSPPSLTVSSPSAATASKLATFTHREQTFPRR